MTELDGLDTRKAVYVIGATNRPDMIDPAMVRPGRLDKLLYVDLPSASERLEVLRAHTKRTPIAEGDHDAIARVVSSSECDGFSGADIAALVREAASLALRGALESLGAFENDNDGIEGGSAVAIPPSSRNVYVTAQHFRAAAGKTRASVSREQRARYERMRDKYAGIPTKGRRTKAERERDERQQDRVEALEAEMIDADIAERVERVGLDEEEVMPGLS